MKLTEFKALIEAAKKEQGGFWRSDVEKTYALFTEFDRLVILLDNFKQEQDSVKKSAMTYFSKRSEQLKLLERLLTVLYA